MKKNIRTIFKVPNKKAVLVLVGLTSALLWQACSSSNGAPHFKDMEELQVSQSTKGVISEVNEIEPGDEFRVINEETIPNKKDSKAIIHYLDKTTDTLSLLALDQPHHGRHHLSGALLRTFSHTMAASAFMNMGNVNTDRSYYSSPAAYDKSMGVKNQLASTSVSRTIKTPGKLSRGYGGAKSFRSFGG